MGVWMYPKPCAYASLRKKTQSSRKWLRIWCLTIPYSRMWHQNTSNSRLGAQFCVIPAKRIWLFPETGIQGFERKSVYGCHLVLIDKDAELRARMKELAEKKKRFDTRRLHILLRQDGLVINHKRMERAPWRAAHIEEMQDKKQAVSPRKPAETINVPYEWRTMDFAQTIWPMAGR